MAYIGIVSSTDSEQLSPNYIGFHPTSQRPSTAFVVDTFVANGVQTVFPLSNPKPLTSRALLVTFNGQLLVPTVDYDLDNTGNLEFTTSPAAGGYITVHHLIFPKNEATSSIRKLDDISSQFDGVQTQFTLTANGAAANILGQNVLIISIDGVIQEPGIAYTTNGDNIIFSEAPQSISSFYAIDVGTTGIGTPSDATVSSEKLLTDNNPTAGKVLAVNSSGGLTWTTVSGSVGATDLDGLADVSVNTPLAGQVLRYNGTTFVNTKLNYSDLLGPPLLSTVATSGNYHDLSNKPTFPTDLSDFTDSTGLLFDGDYNSLTNLPSIPNEITDLTDTDVVTPTNGDVLVWNGTKWINDSLTLNDLGITDGSIGQVLTTDGAGNFTFTSISGGAGSFSGNYNDLTNKPTIPADVGDLTDTGNLLSGTASILVSTNATGDEGGEIQLAKPPNATLTGGIFFDAYQDRLRIYENGGDYRGVHIDLSKAPSGISGELIWKKSGFVNAGTFLTMDNLKVSITTSGARGLSIGAVSTNFTANVSGWHGYTGGGGGASAVNVAYTTTASSSAFGWAFTTEGDGAQYNILDKTNSRMYRVTMMIGQSFNNNFISIERLF